MSEPGPRLALALRSDPATLQFDFGPAFLAPSAPPAPRPRSAPADPGQAAAGGPATAAPVTATSTAPVAATSVAPVAATSTAPVAATSIDPAADLPTEGANGAATGPARKKPRRLRAVPAEAATAAGAGSPEAATAGAASPEAATAAGAGSPEAAVPEVAVPEPVAVIAAGSAPVEVPAAPASSAAARSDEGLLIFDVETTGTDKRRDQVIELCIQFGLEPGARSRTWRFRPTVPISPGAQAVHGISLEDLADCPPFADCAEEISAIFAEAQVIVGYNLTFDIDMLQAEYERLRVAAAERGALPAARLDTRGKTVVDPYRLWQQCEPRSLQHAHQRFVGQSFEAAHSAEADVAATGRVLAGMLRSFGLDAHDWRGIAGVCDPQRPSWVGPTRHLQWDGPAIVITFGKHAGAQVHELARGEFRDYLRWVCDRDFPMHVREVCQRALELPADEFLAWVKAEHGQVTA